MVSRWHCFWAGEYSFLLTYQIWCFGIEIKLFFLIFRILILHLSIGKYVNVFGKFKHNKYEKYFSHDLMKLCFFQSSFFFPHLANFLSSFSLLSFILSPCFHFLTLLIFFMPFFFIAIWNYSKKKKNHLHLESYNLI